MLLKNRNITSSKIKISKVTDYAALRVNVGKTTHIGKHDSVERYWPNSEYALSKHTKRATFGPPSVLRLNVVWAVWTPPSGVISI